MAKNVAYNEKALIKETLADDDAENQARDINNIKNVENNEAKNEQACARLYAKGIVPLAFQFHLGKMGVRIGFRCDAERMRWHAQMNASGDSPSS